MKFLKKFSFRKLLYNKRFTVPFSIFLSFVLWMVISVNQKPIIDRTFSNIGVTINLENTFAGENKMEIIGDISDQKFTVLVMGQNHIVTGLSASDISLYASAATVDSPGEYKLTVSASVTGEDYEVVSISPKTVKVTFDYMETKEFTVTALAEGATAVEGLITEPAVVSGMESNTITITGPRTVINSIETVTAKTQVNKTLSASETFDADIILLDKDEKEISTENLQLSTEKVQITVPISKKKTVPVKVDFTNVPNGFNKDSITAEIDHSTVTVIGTPETVDKIAEIALSPIDISAVSRNATTFEVSPKLPEGVRMFESFESFNVTLNLYGYTERTVTVSEFKFVGLGDGLKATASGSIKNVKICGPSNVVNKLSTSAVYAEIDLTNKKAGEHAVTAKISFSENNNVWAEGTYETTVTVK